ncbi:MAG: hypothetical protein DME01_06945 [Candidatus Rokuibacteriota bacterium]|nr:MAG: hypothetical protein DME01_06945 [Candidatus Rokubacteria bacterium]
MGVLRVQRGAAGRQRNLEPGGRLRDLEGGVRGGVRGGRILQPDGPSSGDRPPVAHADGRTAHPAHPCQEGRLDCAAHRGRRALPEPALVADAGPAFREPSPLERVFNRAFGALVGLGLAPRDYYLLQVRGRKSGRVYATPVSLVTLHGVRFLVAPRGRTQWVRNAEASNEVVLKRGSSRRRFRVRSLADADKPPVLLAYLERYRSVVQRYFPVSAGSPARAFAEIAARYPVFELLPTDDAAATPT